MSEPERDVTLLLARVCQGDSDARDRLFRVVEAELRKIANRLMRKQHGNQARDFFQVALDEAPANSLLARLARDKLNRLNASFE